MPGRKSSISYIASISSICYSSCMSSPALKPIALSRAEQPSAQALEHLLNRGMDRGALTVISSAGDRIDLPDPIVEVLRTAVGYLSHGQAVTLIPDNQVITTQRAADLLGLSRPFFIKLLDAGAMAHHRVGNQRRVYLRDVLAYRRKRDAERDAALDRLSRDAFEAGLYDQNRIPEGSSDE